MRRRRIEIVTLSLKVSMFEGVVKGVEQLFDGESVILMLFREHVRRLGQALSGMTFDYLKELQPGEVGGIVLRDESFDLLPAGEKGLLPLNEVGEIGDSMKPELGLLMVEDFHQCIGSSLVDIGRIQTSKENGAERHPVTREVCGRGYAPLASVPFHHRSVVIGLRERGVGVGEGLLENVQQGPLDLSPLLLVSVGINVEVVVFIEGLQIIPLALEVFGVQLESACDNETDRHGTNGGVKATKIGSQEREKLSEFLRASVRRLVIIHGLAEQGFVGIVGHLQGAECQKESRHE